MDVLDFFEATNELHFVRIEAHIRRVLCTEELFFRGPTDNIDCTLVAVLAAGELTQKLGLVTHWMPHE